MKTGASRLILVGVGPLLTVLAFLSLPARAADSRCPASWRADVQGAVWGTTPEAWGRLCRENGSPEAALEAAKREYVAACLKRTPSPTPEARRACEAGIPRPVPDGGGGVADEARRARLERGMKVAGAASRAVRTSLESGGVDPLFAERARGAAAGETPPPPPAVAAGAPAQPTRPPLAATGPPVDLAPKGVESLQVRVSAPPGAEASAAKARELLGVMLGKADPAVVENLARRRVTVVVIGRNQKLTDSPEFRDLRGKKTFDGRPWEAVRGAGSHRLPDGRWALAVAEENLDDSGAGGYPARFLFVHEFAHMVQLRGLPSYNLGASDAAFKARGLEAAQEASAAAVTGAEKRRAALFAELASRSDGVPPTYEASLKLFKAEKARAGRVPLSDYADSNAEEFFAEATAAYFGVEHKGAHKERLADLLRSRPDVAVFLYKVYGPAPAATLRR